MTSISRDVIHHFLPLGETIPVCLVFTAFEGLPRGCSYFCAQQATLKLQREGSRITQIILEQGKIRAQVTLVTASHETMVCLKIDSRSGGYPALLFVELDAPKRAHQIEQFNQERKEKPFNPMWSLTHILN